MSIDRSMGRHLYILIILHVHFPSALTVFVHILCCPTTRSNRLKPLLRQLHLLPVVHQRILFKMAVLTRKAHPRTSSSTFINAPQLTPYVRHHSHCLPFRTRQLCLHAELLTTQHRQHGTVFLQTF